MTTPTQVRIDSDVKQKANDLFKVLGLDMSTAVNMFLHQCILKGGLPFSVEAPQYSKETEVAMEEARKISRDPSIKGYTTMSDLKSALLSDD